MKLGWRIKKLLGYIICDKKDFINAYGEASCSNMLVAVKQAHSGHCRPSSRFNVKVLGTYEDKLVKGRFIYVGEFDYKNLRFEYYITDTQEAPMKVEEMIERRYK